MTKWKFLHFLKTDITFGSGASIQGQYLDPGRRSSQVHKIAKQTPTQELSDR